MNYYRTPDQMITISKKFFCLLLLGLATLAVASLCSILQLPIDKAVMAFVATWLGLIIIFEMMDFTHPTLPGGPSKQQ